MVIIPVPMGYNILNNMQVNNLDAARRLVEKYRSITKKDLKSNACKNDEYCYEVLSKITGFGSLKKCYLCKECGYTAGNPDCNKCLYSRNNTIRSGFPCIKQDTYCDIHDAESLDELYEAIQNRADFIEDLIEEIENDNEI